MKKLNLVVAVVLATAVMVGAPASSLAAGGHVPTACKDGTAPEGWLRDGGFCELAAKGPDTTSKKAAPEPAA